MNHELLDTSPPISRLLKNVIIVMTLILHCISWLSFVSYLRPYLVCASHYQASFIGLSKNIGMKINLWQKTQSDSIDQAVANYPLIFENQTQSNRAPYFYLLSLQWTDGAGGEGKFSKPVADIWRWKDAVLGDGRDFFVPKPNTLRSLQSYLMCTDNDRCFEISECVVLSNCARFDILLVVNNSTAHSDQNQLAKIVASEISSLLVYQVQSYLKMKNPFKASASAVLDLAGLIHPNPRPKVDEVHLLQPDIREVSNNWNAFSGPRDIAHYLCLVAAGLATRPRRPHRDVVFQPFSSRDAHILLQLKRTADIAAGTKGSSMIKSSSHLLTLLKFGIQAGKASRNPHQLPVLMELRNKYGETGNSRKYDLVPPPETIQMVVQAVHDEIINPLVQECVDHFIAKEASGDISALRNHALSLAENQLERQFIQSQLHEPTMLLRQMMKPGSESSSSDQDFKIIKNWNVSQFWEQLRANLTELRENGT